MSESMSLKRARLEDADASSPTDGPPRSPPTVFQGLVQNGEFWFEDGTIVLTAGYVAFKIYKGPLVEHSPVFRDMLSLPQPDAHQVESCPVVPLSDAPMDVSCLLGVLMPNKRAIRPFGLAHPPYPVIAAWIRLGHKYQIHSLVEQSLQYLRTLYPDNVKHLNKQPRYPALCAIGVVNLARLTGAHYLLPVALAECCTLGEEIVSGFVLPDGRREQLSRVDLGACFRAKDKIIAKRVRAAERMFRGLPEECKRGGDCESDMEFFLMFLMKGTIGSLCVPRVDISWSASAKKLYRLCSKCWDEVRGREEDEQVQLFRELPSLFGIQVPGWDAAEMTQSGEPSQPAVAG
ncbi:hypothetical protein BV20DRAFT_705100 [Pilatotrama ljubarskyi]|nr:hypothetical protein BV20DRAFT_705100 [Pilatotrama ljubarskyi]